MQKTAGRLLIVVCRLFDHEIDRKNCHEIGGITVPIDSSIDIFIEQQVVRPLEKIGQYLPYRDFLAKWLMEEKPFANEGIMKILGKFVGLVGKRHDEVHKAVLALLTHGDKFKRVVAAFALAVGWSEDPQTSSFLHEFVINDPDEDVRIAALTALVEHFRDDSQIAYLVCDCALKDKGSNARSSALTILATFFSTEPQTFILLRYLTLKEIDEGVRETASNLIVRLESGVWPNRKT